MFTFYRAVAYCERKRFYLVHEEVCPISSLLVDGPRSHRLQYSKAEHTETRETLLVALHTRGHVVTGTGMVHIEGCVL